MENHDDYLDPMDLENTQDQEPDFDGSDAQELLEEADALLQDISVEDNEENDDVRTAEQDPYEPTNGQEDNAGFDRELNELLGEPLAASEAESGGEQLQPPVIPAGEEFRDQEYRDTFGDDLDRAFGDVPEESDESGQDKGPQRRKLPRKPKKGSGMFGIPHFLATILYFAVILAVSMTLARMLWLCADDMLALTKQDRPVSVTIAETDTMEDIADKLVDAGLVRYKKVFLFYSDIFSAREKISTGTFELNEKYDYMAMVQHMSRYSSARNTVEVMIPEGYNCRQIFELLEEKGVCSAERLEEASMEGDLDDYWFLEGVRRDSKYCLEGFLFPDTYEFYEGDDPERVLNKLLDTFDYRFSDSMQDMIPQLNEKLASMMRENGYDEAYIEDHRFTIREVVIVASLIEEETAGNAESAKIASVIYNRLTNAAAYPYLDIDASILYALGEHKEVLTAEDLKIDSPYNTRINPGLPVGPISNPGLASLKAALNPENTNYHYYALDEETGLHHFSGTYEEHQAFLQSQTDGE